MPEPQNTRREFMKMVGIGAAAMGVGAEVRTVAGQDEPPASQWVDPEFFIKPEELVLRFRQPAGPRQLSFAGYTGTPYQWRQACRAKHND